MHNYQHRGFKIMNQQKPQPKAMDKLNSKLRTSPLIFNLADDFVKPLGVNQIQACEELHHAFKDSYSYIWEVHETIHGHIVMMYHNEIKNNYSERPSYYNDVKRFDWETINKLSYTKFRWIEATHGRVSIGIETEAYYNE